MATNTLLCLFLGTSVLQVTATDADDPTYGNSARIVYSILQGQPYFSVDPKTGAVQYHCSKHLPLLDLLKLRVNHAGTMIWLWLWPWSWYHNSRSDIIKAEAAAAGVMYGHCIVWSTLCWLVKNHSGSKETSVEIFGKPLFPHLFAGGIKTTTGCLLTAHLFLERLLLEAIKC